MSILVATDFSPCSQAAVRLAAALARRRGVPLLLRHAVEHPVADIPAVPIGPTGWEATLVSEAEAAIGREAGELRRGGIHVDTRVSVGSAASLVLETAAGRDVDLIVVGTHGRKGGAHLFLGSVAETVVRSATCPVLVTRDAPAELERWQGQAPLRLTVATDGAHAGEAAFSWAGSFARGSACELSALRVYWPPEEAMRYGLNDPWSEARRGTELLPLLRRDLERDTRASIGAVPPQLRFRAAGSEASQVLSEEAVALGADALVIGVPRRRPARWAVIAPGAVLRSSSLPVLCIPEAMVPARRRIPEMRTVLIATDLSDASAVAIPVGYALLRAGGGRVELCTMHVVGPAGPIADTPLATSVRDQERVEAEARLRALIPPEAAGLGITTSVSVSDARSAVEGILAAAERLDADAIVVGSHGRSGFTRAVLGSVAEAVARQSRRPVLIARGRMPDAAN
jgi:nucleotide-binding universal stress UspA family protein